MATNDAQTSTQLGKIGAAPGRRALRQVNAYPLYWAECYGTSPFLPMSRQEMDELGWDSCDIILVSGDAYVDHPSFGMAIVGRLLESQGFRVGIIGFHDQPLYGRQKDPLR